MTTTHVVGQIRTFAGEIPYTDIVVMSFPDLTTAKSWHDSEAYQALVPLREGKEVRSL